jgi:hypothetical protein
LKMSLIGKTNYQKKLNRWFKHYEF